MIVPELIGGAAAIITTLCWLPQALHIIKTRETRGVSLLSYVAFGIGLVFWLAYGVMIDSLPIICANTVTGALVIVIVFLKIQIDGIGLKS